MAQNINVYKHCTRTEKFRSMYDYMHAALSFVVLVIYIVLPYKVEIIYRCGVSTWILQLMFTALVVALGFSLITDIFEYEWIVGVVSAAMIGIFYIYALFLVSIVWAYWSDRLIKNDRTSQA